MNCEQFEAIVLDLERDGAASSLEKAAAVAHLSSCSRCAALHESWQAARQELRALSEATVAQAPARVEMRLRQEFRTRHRTFVARRTAFVAVWTLATAAVLVGTVSWIEWQKTRSKQATKHEMVTPAVPTKDSAVSAQNGAGVQSEQLGILYAPVPSDDGAGDFTPLPGALLAETEEAAIVRVRMQRSALGALGFPVNEESAGEWIQVDLMVGDDGLPQAVRLAR